MSNSSQPEETPVNPTTVQLAHMDLAAVLNNTDADSLMFAPTMDSIFLPEEDQTASFFSPGNYSMSGDMELPADNEGNFAASSGEPAFQNSALIPFDTEMHSPLQLLVAQAQSLATRVQYLEASLQQSSETVGYLSLRLEHLATSAQKTNSMVDKLTTWSNDMEAHYREQNRMILDLVGMVQKTDSGVGDAESLSSTATPTM
ncbi:hypothetical protein HYQ45_007589 [Verticillium longisporum]|uniref:Uncharacterized protein n=1 Tax=Verticillium longisporum TaxID=100787 RepID=A0A8I3AUB9_VERLO|nr:hypothetical protein HYQ45_007589 [Verticillium longisporum]